MNKIIALSYRELFQWMYSLRLLAIVMTLLQLFSTSSVRKTVVLFLY